MCIRRIPYTIRSSVAILGQIPLSIDEAAESLGASKLKTLVRITVPMMANGIFSGAVMSWVTLITELSSSILLYSFKTQTLNVAIYTMVSKGADGRACALSTILMAFTAVSLLLFNKFSKDGEIMKIKTKNAIQGYLFLLPLIVLLLSLSFYPLLRTIFLSFQDVKLATLNRMRFSGLKNYRTVFTSDSPNFLKVILPNTFWYVFGSVLGQIGIGFFLALALNNKSIRAKGFFRSIIILPWVVSSIIISISWRFMTGWISPPWIS